VEKYKISDSLKCSAGLNCSGKKWKRKILLVSKTF
jgi:hypothetical protein